MKKLLLFFRVFNGSPQECSLPFFSLSALIQKCNNNKKQMGMPFFSFFFFVSFRFCFVFYKRKKIFFKKRKKEKKRAPKSYLLSIFSNSATRSRP